MLDTYDTRNKHTTEDGYGDWWDEPTRLHPARVASEFRRMSQAIRFLMRKVESTEKQVEELQRQACAFQEAIAKKPVGRPRKKPKEVRTP